VVALNSNQDAIDIGLTRTDGPDRSMAFFAYQASSDHTFYSRGFVEYGQQRVALGDHPAGGSGVALADDVSHGFSLF